MKKLLFLFAFSILLFISCKKETPLKRFSFNGETMGSYYAITYYAKKPLVEQNTVDSFLKEFNKSLSTWDKASNITAINNATEKHFADSFFRYLYGISKGVNTISNGAFDPSASPLFETWGFGLKNAENIDSASIDSILNYVGIAKFQLVNDTLYKPSAQAQFSFNAIAPGYAADLLGKAITAKGINSYLIDIGGEFKSQGIKPDSSKWTVGIEQPIENKTGQNKAQAYITLNSGEALATSGNYRKFYYKDGKRYSHTINPKTGYPVSHNLLSATIITDNATLADAYATTCMVLGLENAKIFVKEQGVKAYFIYDDNGTLKEYVTQNLKSQFSN